MDTKVFTSEELTWSKFEKKYKPTRNKITKRDEINGWMFETYGKDLAHILKLASNAETANTVWTIKNDDNGNLCICNGYSLVNRLGYIVCKVPFADGCNVFVQDEDDIMPDILDDFDEN